MSNTPHRDTYTLPATASGLALRANLAASLTAHGITFEQADEVITVGNLSFNVVTLTVTGKRPGLGQIAAQMKERKS